MINSHEYIYQKILTRYLKDSGIINGDIDPIDINKAKFYTRAVFIAYIFAKNEHKHILNIEEMFKWYNTNISDNCLFANIRNSIPSILYDIFDSYDIPVYEGNIGLLYERLLNIETLGIDVIKGKEYRNNLGSYYTPQILAEALISKTVNQYIKNGNDNLHDAKIVDFSCGAGIFLIGAIDYIAKIIGKNESDIGSMKRQIAKNISACDVDCIALEIAKLSILKYVEDFSLYALLNKNFHHANFLVHSNTAVSDAVRKETTMCGYIYHESLPLDINSMPKYDIVLGNPPWEKIRFEEKSFYSQFTDKLKNIHFKFELPLLIEQTHRSNSKINLYARDYKLHLQNIKAKIKQDKYFKNSYSGELNTCTLFADSAYQMLSNNGVLGLIVKSSLLTSQVNKLFFNKIKNNLYAVYDFVNRQKYFDIDGRERFSLMIAGAQKSNNFYLGMNLQNLPDIDNSNIKVSVSDFEIINPETNMLPNLYSTEDLTILLKMYRTIPTLLQSFPEVKYGRLVHLTNHISFIDREPGQDNIAVYEGKFFTIFDGAYSGFNNVDVKDRYKSKASSKKLTTEQKQKGEFPVSRFFIKKEKWAQLSKQYNAEYMLAWHSLTSASNTRTCVATILPFIPASQSVQFLVTKNDDDLLYLAGIFNSIVFDYILKSKLNGIDLTQSILNQMPIPPLKLADEMAVNELGISAKDTVIQICSLLLSTDTRLEKLCNKVCITAPSLHKLNRNELFHLLEITVAKLYNFTIPEFTYILSRFGKEYNDKTADLLVKRYSALF